jgi:hypothetical protein
MATSVYFNNYNSKGEQRLIEDIIVESIKIMGFDSFYLPIFNPEDRDILYGEDPVKKFTQAFNIEMYLSSAEGYEGQQDFFSKFGLEIRDSVRVILSKRSFEERVPQNTFTRPREGDLVYVPFLNGTGELYEITFVEQAKDFHQLGRQNPYFYELKMEKFKYSQEIINTGDTEIDVVVTDSAYSIELTTSAGSGSGNFTIGETVTSNTASAVVQSWKPALRHLVVNTIAGVFADGQRITGQTSGVSYLLNTYDPQDSQSRHEVYDNTFIATSADTITNTEESNPFGTI